MDTPATEGLSDASPHAGPPYAPHRRRRGHRARGRRRPRPSRRPAPPARSWPRTSGSRGGSRSCRTATRSSASGSTARCTGSRRRGGRHAGRHDLAVVDAGEGGLLGIAVAPTFAGGDRWVYFYFTSTADDNRIVRKRVPRRRARADPAAARRHPRGVEPQRRAARVRPGRDAVREHRRRRRHRLRAQDHGSLGGKILRMTPTGRSARRQPVRQPGVELRPPQRPGARLGRPRPDVGHRARPEHPRRAQPDPAGPQLRLARGRGRRRRRAATPTRSSPGAPTNCSPSGIAIARGRAWVGALRGRVPVVGAAVGGTHSGRKVRHFHDDFGRIRTVQKAPDGSLWITTSQPRRPRRSRPRADDRVIRITL